MPRKDKKMKKAIFLLMLPFLVGASTSVACNATQKPNEAVFAEEEKEVVLSADMLLHDYYSDVVNANVGKKILSFEEFKKEYLESPQTIDVFTQEKCKDPVFKEYVKPTGPVKLKASSSGVADYIISPTTYTQTPVSAFRRVPVYRNFFDYNSLVLIDIINETNTIMNDMGHTACITNLNATMRYSNGTTASFIQTIEAVDGPGVSYGFLDDERICHYGVNIYRLRFSPYLGNSDRQEVIYFLKRQLGKGFELSPAALTQTNLGIDKNKWYCTQLVEGAYRYAGLEINTASYQCTTEQRLMPGSLIPAAIPLCGPIRIIEDIAPEHLKLSIAGYNNGFLGIGSYWTISVYNPFSYSIPIQYNSKMCFDADGEKWSGLLDVKNDSINGYQTKTFKVYTNFAADAIAFSRVLDVWTPNGYRYSSVRYITYAKNLNSANGTLTERYNIKDRDTVFNYYDSH